MTLNTISAGGRPRRRVAVSSAARHRTHRACWVCKRNFATKPYKKAYRPSTSLRLDRCVHLLCNRQLPRGSASIVTLMKSISLLALWPTVLMHFFRRRSQRASRSSHFWRRSMSSITLKDRANGISTFTLPEINPFPHAAGVLCRSHAGD